AGAAPAAWTYVNRTFQLPAGFPNVQLWHNYSMPAAGSGMIYMDNLFYRAIPAPSATNWTTLVPFAATWRYNTNTPPANWFTPAELQSTHGTVTPQGNAARYYDLTPFAALLVPGLNTIAVQLNNAWSSWDDIAFDLRLQTVVTHRPRPRLNVTFPTPATPT